jgi:hypothetical protein
MAAKKPNYSLRIAKHIERKMLCEAFRRLSEFGTVETYRYVGFGSWYFTDFTLFHKQLGITNMLSIERDTTNKDRYAFNIPFGCIRVAPGHSNQLLPTLDWDVRTIAWLDYDGDLNSSALTDIKFVSSNAIPGSLVVVTVNAHSDLEEGAVQRLSDNIGAERVPAGTTDADFTQWKKAGLYRTIITNEINKTLIDRNGDRAPGSKICYKQLFNFHYADEARMLTVGGLFYDEGQAGIVASCSFDSLPFVRSNESPYLIDVPRLTYRELRHLDAQLPITDYKQLKHACIPDDDLEKYSRLYRHFPTFAEAEM